jgi:hypothetical protein
MESDCENTKSPVWRGTDNAFDCFGIGKSGASNLPADMLLAQMKTPFSDER